MDNLDFCGIEVSAEQLVVALRREGQLEPFRTFPNTPASHADIACWLARPARQVRVCLESTGVYGLDLALVLEGRPGLQVMVANPRAVRHFAQALMRRSKTDRIDAQVLVEFAARMPFQLWPRPAPAVLELRAITRRLEALTELATAEKNRLHATQACQALPAVVRRDLRRSLRALERALEKLTQAARKLLTSHPGLERRFALLTSTPGIAQRSALPILAELALLAPNLSVRQWVAHAGLDPREYSSGSSVHKKTRISKAGNRHLRRALYMPALVATQHDPHLRAFYLHLLQKGKAKMQALVAVMRKLLHVIYGMFKHHQAYDGSKVYRIPKTLESKEVFSTSSGA